MSDADTLIIALSKGRILRETLPLLAHAGIEPAEHPQRSRRLILDTALAQVRLLIVRASDAPTYVEHGGADVGVTGKDVLMEYGGQGLYEPLDLGIARCRLVVAGRSGANVTARRARVATKYVNITRRYFAEQGRQVELIKLYGSMELAPLVGLADFIVDLVDTGSTLRANGLAPFEHIAEISSRLVVNRAAMKTKHQLIKPFVQRMQRAVEATHHTEPGHNSVNLD